MTNPYGVSKRSAEDYLTSFADLHGLEPVSLRLGNVYGPRQDPARPGWWPSSATGCWPASR